MDKTHVFQLRTSSTVHFVITSIYIESEHYSYPEIDGTFLINIRHKNKKKTLFEFGFWITINTSSQELFTEYTYIVAQDTYKY